MERLTQEAQAAAVLTKLAERLPCFQAHVCFSSLLVTHEASQFPTPPQAAAPPRLATIARLPFLILLFAQSSMCSDNGTALRSMTGTKVVM